ncbi:MAG TPA: hypothetical protein DIT94_13100 [Deltaproteobacteria bacterium]|nr:hypothetical protein [Deltaproteobacteria bacterium]
MLSSGKPIPEVISFQINFLIPIMCILALGSQAESTDWTSSQAPGNYWKTKESKTFQKKNYSQSLAEMRVETSVDRKWAGTLIFEDVPRKESLHVIRELKKLGIRVYLLSGDRQETVQSLAKALEIEATLGAMLPDMKIRYLKELQSDGKITMMIGDGINDAPSLHQADVGVAVHNAREISIDAADVLLTRANLESIPELIRLSRIARRTILQNLCLSLGYNTLTIPLAMIGWVNPLLAAAAMAGSSVTVVLNSLRQKKQIPA